MVSDHSVAVQRDDAKEHKRLQINPVELFLAHRAQVQVAVSVETEQTANEDEAKSSGLVKSRV